MRQGVQVVGRCLRGQDQALAFYVGKLGSDPSGNGWKMIQEGRRA